MAKPATSASQYTSVDEKRGQVTMHPLSSDKLHRIFSYTSGVASAAFFLALGITIDAWRQISKLPPVVESVAPTLQRIELQIELNWGLFVTVVLFLFSLRDWYNKWSLRYEITHECRFSTDMANRFGTWRKKRKARRTRARALASKKAQSGS